MTLIVCLDERNGLLFNGRRLSRDIEVCRRCLQICAGSMLRMNAYSYKLFETLDGDISVDENLPEGTDDRMVYFAETVLPDMNTVKKLIVFRWNRHYPSDIRLSPEEYGFRKLHNEEFTGKSHPIITLEVYER